MGHDWLSWHDEYDRPGSRLAQRLDVVRERVRIALDGAPPGPLRVVSVVAGQGRDLIPVLAAHPRRDDVTARLVELDPRNAAIAAAAAAGLPGVQVVTGDAAPLDQYADLAPVDLLLLCGLFGNISEADIVRTVSATAPLVRRGGTVIWTRYRGTDQRLDWICGVFAEQGYDLVWVSDPALDFGVGVHRAGRAPGPLPAGVNLFTFVGHDAPLPGSG